MLSLIKEFGELKMFSQFARHTQPSLLVQSTTDNHFEGQTRMSTGLLSATPDWNSREQETQNQCTYRQVTNNYCLLRIGT